MNNSNLYVLIEGELTAVVGKFQNAFIVQKNNQYLLIPNYLYPTYNLAKQRNKVD
ncbi:hypothetical protein [Pedobacter sp. SYSU D00535]|uniref:hypothetical protein n=1 Tax=Pedobacter sp. SYSU D00535 TaxID=2810308 RepID=UPI001A96A9B2|nr:hypothetical protein [Pedobacter sp. SYSU D00535]